MMRSLFTRGTFAVGGLALALAAGAGSASADPVYGPMTDTTCTYEQAMAAVNAENPTAAQYLQQSPANLQFLQVYVNSTPAKRVDLLNQIRSNQGAAQALPVFQQMLTSCSNY